MDDNVVLKALGGEASMPDLKALGEALMSKDKITNYHLALIRAKNYAVIGGKQLTFSNSEGAADLLQGVRDKSVSKNKVLADTAVAIESFDGKTYFDHRKFSEKVRKHSLKGR